MCVSRMNCVCWANLFCAVQELFQRHYGEKSCILPPRGTSGHRKNEGTFKDKGLWPKIDSDAGRGYKSFHGCHEFQVPEPMKRVKPPTGPWQDVVIDFMGPLPTRESLLVVVDYCSRFYEVAIMRLTAAKRVVVVLIQIFSRYGFPFALKSDNSPQFC